MPDAVSASRVNLVALQNKTSTPALPFTDRATAGTRLFTFIFLDLHLLHPALDFLCDLRGGMMPFFSFRVAALGHGGDE